MERISEHIYYLPAEKDCPALGLICGEGYSLLVDAGNKAENVEIILSFIKEMHLSPLKYVVLTHHHSDHATCLQDFIDTSDDVISISGMKALQYIDHINLAFTDELELDLGNLSCTIKEVSGSHTKDAVVVSVPSEKVLFLGDVLYTTIINKKVCYSRQKTMELINALQDINADKYVFGHDPLCLPDKEGMKQMLKQLTELAGLIDRDMEIAEAIEKFQNFYGREPMKDEVFILKSFISGFQELD